MARRSAISALDSPRPRQPSTSSSRGVSASRTAGPAPPSGRAPPRRPRAGELRDQPPGHRRGDQPLAGRHGAYRGHQCGRVAVLEEEARPRPPAAPRRRTRPGRRWSAPAHPPAALGTTCGWRRPRRGGASGCPSARRAGRSSRASRTASSPSSASPTTSMPGAERRMRTSPARTADWSSATRTRIGCASAPVIVAASSSGGGQCGPHQPDCAGRPALRAGLECSAQQGVRSRIPTRPVPEPGARGAGTVGERAADGDGERPAAVLGEARP